MTANGVIGAVSCSRVLSPCSTPSRLIFPLYLALSLYSVICASFSSERGEGVSPRFAREVCLGEPEGFQRKRGAFDEPCFSQANTRQTPASARPPQSARSTWSRPASTPGGV